jgi:hypothetical protein
MVECKGKASLSVMLDNHLRGEHDDSYKLMKAIELVRGYSWSKRNGVYAVIAPGDYMTVVKRTPGLLNIGRLIEGGRRCAGCSLSLIINA